MLKKKSNAWRHSVLNGGITNKNAVLTSGYCATHGITNSAYCKQSSPNSLQGESRGLTSHNPNEQNATRACTERLVRRLCDTNSRAEARKPAMQPFRIKLPPWREVADVAPS